MLIKKRFHYTDNGIPFLGIEEIPKKFTVEFNEINKRDYPEVIITVKDLQAGDIINDNSYENDCYRYHDIFHYSFATLLHWSPCTRALLKRKRKSNALLDRVEDGARAIITEEAISLMIFNDAKENDFYESKKQIDPHLIDFIRKMVSPFEVNKKNSQEWEETILKAYDIFRDLVHNKGGRVIFDLENKNIKYENL